MSLEDHPRVIRSPDKASDSSDLPPYLLRIPGTIDVWLTEEDLLILYATCERMLKEGEE